MLTLIYFLSTKQAVPVATEPTIARCAPNYDFSWPWRSARPNASIRNREEEHAYVYELFLIVNLNLTKKPNWKNNENSLDEDEKRWLFVNQEPLWTRNTVNMNIFLYLVGKICVKITVRCSIKNKKIIVSALLLKWNKYLHVIVKPLQKEERLSSNRNKTAQTNEVRIRAYI